MLRDNDPKILKQRVQWLDLSYQIPESSDSCPAGRLQSRPSFYEDIHFVDQTTPATSTQPLLGTGALFSHHQTRPKGHKAGAQVRLEGQKKANKRAFLCEGGGNKKTEARS